jgi:hypothetical protein
MVDNPRVLAKAPVELTRLFLPLALSWLFMSIEGPIATAIISRLPGSKVQQAAFFALLGISLFIESPAIDFISTGTTLTKGWKSYLSIRKFAFISLGISTILHALFAFTPLFGFISSTILRLEPNIAAAMLIPSIFFIPWTAAVGWRRFHQGVMIRYGDTKPVRNGTILRMTVLTLSGFGLTQVPEISGLAVVAIALNLSVIAEAIFCYGAALPYLRQMRHEHSPEDAEVPLSRIAKFHLPLTGSTMISFVVMPLVASFLSQMPGAILNSAAWSAANGLIWPFRAMTYALPEVIIKVRDQYSSATLKQFSFKVGLVCSLVGILLTVTPTAFWFMTKVLGVEPEIARVAAYAVMLASVGPLLTSTSAYYRGMLTSIHATQPRLWSIGVGLLVMIGVFVVAFVFNLPPIPSAAAATLLALLAELLVLAAFWRKLSVTA